jgi:hypothetical protein
MRVLRLLSAIVGSALILSLSYARAEVFSEYERAIILAFPTDNGELDWQELSDRQVNPIGASSKSSESYCAAIVALRTGKNEQAEQLADQMAGLADSEADKTKSELLRSFLTFYTAPAASRNDHKAQLLKALSRFSDTDMEIDWLAGTSASVLIEHALTSSDPILSAETESLVGKLLSARTDLQSRIWLVNVNMKAAYTSGLTSNASPEVDPHQFLDRAVGILAIAQAGLDDGEQLEALRVLYNRSQTLDGVIRSRFATRNEKYDAPPLRQIGRFHPPFQTRCVTSITYNRERLSVRRGKIGTGGMMLLVTVNNEGRAKFKSVIDAQPSSLDHEDMYRYYRKIAASMRIEVDESDPDCLKGGDLIVPFSLHWD